MRVAPAEAGVRFKGVWIPASAGMTNRYRADMVINFSTVLLGRNTSWAQKYSAPIEIALEAMKLFQSRFPVILVLILVLLDSLPASAQTPAVSRGAAPEWVEPVEVAPATAIPVDEIHNGQYFLLVDRQIRVEEKTPTQYYQHYAIQIANASGMEAASQVSISFDPDYQTLAFHKLIIRRNGRIIDKLSQAKIQLLRREEELESQIYDGRYTADVIVSDIRVGDVIEYAYTLAGDNPIYNNIFSYDVATSWSVPILRNKFILKWPRARQLFQKSHNCKALLASKDLEDYTIYSLDQKHIKPIRRNSETPSWYRRYGLIQLSETRAWSDVVAWALPLYRPADRPDVGVKALSERLVKTAQTDEDKVMRVLSYLQNKIRYLGIEFGINSHKPSPPQSTLARRYGDCKDKVVLLVALLNAQGFETHPVLVNTTLRKSVVNLHPTIDAFDHVIARTTVNGKQYWIDPSRRYQGQNLAKLFQPHFDVALVVAQGETGLTKIPSGDDLVGVQIEETFDLRDGFQKPVHYRLVSHHQGLNAEKIRSWLADEGRQKLENDYFNYYTKYYRKIETAEPVKVVDDKKQNKLRLYESYRINNFWTKNDEDKQLQCSFYTNALYSYLKKPKQLQRHEPFNISYPVNVRQSIRILLPEPWAMSTFDFLEQNSHFKFRSEVSYDSDSNTLHLDYHYRSYKDFVMPDELRDYIAALDRVNEKLDYFLSKTLDSDATSTVHPALGWVQANIYFVVIAVFAIMMVYCLVEWRIDARRPAPAEAGEYYPVSLVKLFILSIATLNIYQLFWFYRNWKYIKQRDDSAIMPFWRAVFTPLWFFPFYRDLKHDSEIRLDKSILPNAAWITLLLISMVGLNIADRFDESYEFIGVLSVLCLLPFANYILFINRSRPETTKHNSRFRPRHYLLSAVAAAVIVLQVGQLLYWIPVGEVVEGHRLPR